MSSTMMAFHQPNDEVTCLIGKIVLSHEHLSHVLKMYKKSIDGLTVAEAVKTAGKKGAAALRNAALKKSSKIKEPEIKSKIETYIKRAEELTKYRNHLVHGLWVQVDGKAPSIKSIDGCDYPLPSIDELTSYHKKLDFLVGEMNKFRLSHINA